MNHSREIAQNASWALVTGGAVRVGKIIALELAQLGYNIIVHYFQDEIRARETALQIQAIGREAYLVQADLRDPKQIEQMFSGFGRYANPLKIVVNSAAVMPANKLCEISVDKWEDVLDLNLRAPLLVARAALKRLESGSLILNIGDEFAHQNWKIFPAYGLTKATLEHLTRILAQEIGPAYRIAGLALGPVLPPEGYPPENWDKIVKRSAYQGALAPAVIGQALAAMIESEYISGTFLTVNQILAGEVPISQAQP